MSLTLIPVTRLGHQCGAIGRRGPVVISTTQQMEGGLLAVVDSTPPIESMKEGVRKKGLFYGWMTAAARLREPISDTSLPRQSPSPSSQDPLPLVHVPVSCTLQWTSAPLTYNYVWPEHKHKLCIQHAMTWMGFLISILLMTICNVLVALNVNKATGSTYFIISTDQLTTCGCICLYVVLYVLYIVLFIWNIKIIQNSSPDGIAAPGSVADRRPVEALQQATGTR